MSILNYKDDIKYIKSNKGKNTKINLINIYNLLILNVTFEEKPN